MCINLVHKEGGNGTRVCLIVQPEELSSMGFCLCAWPTLIPLFSLSTSPWLRSIWKMSTHMHILFTGFSGFIVGKATKCIKLTSASRMVHLDIRSTGSSRGCGVPPSLKLFGLLHLFIIVISWREINILSFCYCLEMYNITYLFEKHTVQHTSDLVI